MGKGMQLCLCVAHVCLDSIFYSFGFYMHKYECIDMCDPNKLCESFSHIYVYTHMNDDLVNIGKGVLTCILY